jgi:hypothetical protein
MNAVFWDVAPCGCCYNRHFASIFRVERTRELGTLAVTSNWSTLVTANVVPSSLILSTLKMEAKRRFLHDLYGATSQNTAFFTVTAVKTSNLTQH